MLDRPKEKMHLPCRGSLTKQKPLRGAFAATWCPDEYLSRYRHPNVKDLPITGT
jgi:hypothetical protein